MAMRRPPRTLPGTDALLLQQVFLVIFLGMVVVILALSMATAAALGAQAQEGHLPWPIVQWAVTTPLGPLAIALVGGLAAGLPPLLWVRRVAPVAMRPVDVTELPLSAWPRPLPPWRRPGGPTPAEYWLGRGWRQRVLSLLALALAGLLVLGSFAAFSAVAWYGLTHLPDCSGPRCPPTYNLPEQRAPLRHLSPAFPRRTLLSLVLVLAFALLAVSVAREAPTKRGKKHHALGVGQRPPRLHAPSADSR